MTGTGDIKVRCHLLNKGLASILETHRWHFLLIPKTHIEPPTGHFQVKERVLQTIHDPLIQLLFCRLSFSLFRSMDDIETDLVGVAGGEAAEFLDRAGEGCFCDGESEKE